MNAFWGLGQLMFSKTIIVVDKDVDVHDLSQVAWIVGTLYGPLRGVQTAQGPRDELEHAGEPRAAGRRRGDAARERDRGGMTPLTEAFRQKSRA